jgi:CHAT domain-containing protein
MPALYDGNHYLVEDFTNVVFTPASERYISSAGPTVLTAAGFGVSHAHPGFQALPEVRPELDSVIADSAHHTHGAVKGRLLFDQGFTKVALKQGLQTGPRVIHLATHFVFRPGRVQDSFLLLGNGDHFTLAQLKDMRGALRSSELLTLSACETARGGGDSVGKEVDGLAMVAHRKGSRAVVASLWPVADESTRLLMQDFYRQWTTNRAPGKGEALRHAQLSILHGPAAGDAASLQHPYYWAGFILFGNWE